MLIDTESTMKQDLQIDGLFWTLKEKLRILWAKPYGIVKQIGENLYKVGMIDGRMEK